MCDGSRQAVCGIIRPNKYVYVLHTHSLTDTHTHTPICATEIVNGCVHCTLCDGMYRDSSSQTKKKNSKISCDTRPKSRDIQHSNTICICMEYGAFAINHKLNEKESGTEEGKKINT